MSGADGLGRGVSGLSAWAAVSGDEMGDAWGHAFVKTDGILSWVEGEYNFAVVSPDCIHAEEW